MFTQQFGPFVIEGDSIACEVDGFTATATIYRDDNGDTPEERDDGFWPSLDPKSAGYIGPRSKSTLARHLAKAKRIMQAWEADEWFYCGISVTVERNGIQLVAPFHAAVWGVECNYPNSDNAYLGEVANELLPEAIKDARAKLSMLCKAEA